MGPLDVLTILGLPEALVKSCRDMLEENALSIHDGKPSNVGGAVFGPSPSGQLLEHDTSVAHQHVADALQQMVAGLRGYADNLDAFAKNVTETDLQAAADLTPTRKRELDLATNNLAAPNFHNPGNQPASAGGEG
jgi:hypothetical protein